MPIAVTLATSSSGVPRIQVSVTSSSGATITAVSLFRTTSGGTVPVEVQPSIGPSPRLVNDYLADWDTTLVYSAFVTTADGTENPTSAGVILTSAYPYAIHPLVPALSIRLDQATPLAAGLRTIGNVTRTATDTGHSVLGSPYRVYTRTGPRAAATVQLELVTVTTLEAQAVRAIVGDLTPLLIRVPDSLGWDFEDGYYRVGDVDEARRVQYGPDTSRVFTLPLERVLQPAGVQQPERTYANVLNDFPSYSALLAAYRTYTDVLTDTRT